MCHRVPVRLVERKRGCTLRIAKVRLGRKGTVRISVRAEVGFNSYFIAKMLSMLQLNQQAPV